MSKAQGGPCPHSELNEAAPSGAAQPASDSGGSPSASYGTPRLVTRGESPIGPIAIVDWLTFTVLRPGDDPPVQWVETLRRELGIPELAHGEPETRKFFGFQQSCPLVIPRDGESIHVGLLAWGGISQRNRILVSLQGSLCARVEDWAGLRQSLEQHEARITRLDIAHDDCDGEMSVDWAVEAHRQGLFKAGGRSPKTTTEGDWLERRAGRTLYVGGAGHGKRLRVYEKGKQLGDLESAWVRWEVQFGNRDRWIPYEALIDCASYAAAAYPVLSFLSATPKRIPTRRRVVRTTLTHLTNCLASSYGKTINALLLQGLDADDILAQVLRPGLPKRLRPAIAATEPGSKAYGDGES
jgi:DNA relaxase NicK